MRTSEYSSVCRHNLFRKELDLLLESIILRRVSPTTVRAEQVTIISHSFETYSLYPVIFEPILRKLQVLLPIKIYKSRVMVGLTFTWSITYMGMAIDVVATMDFYKAIIDLCIKREDYLRQCFSRKRAWEIRNYGTFPKDNFRVKSSARKAKYVEYICDSMQSRLEELPKVPRKYIQEVNTFDSVFFNKFNKKRIYAK